MDDLRLQVSVRADCQQPHRHRQLEPLRPARARIEVQHALAPVEVGHMRMPGEDGGQPPRRRVQVQRVS